jgi:sterol desaturase/sphingolipid hydroxylase (fatty acid hydroxylase superfamily)
MTVFDYYLLHNQHHQNVLKNVLVILGAALLVGALGFFIPKAGSRIARKDVLEDFAMMFFVKFGLIGLFFGVKEVLSQAPVFRSGPTPGGWELYPLTSYLTLPPLVSLVLYIVIRDLGQWVKHYSLHKVPCLWALHKVHHANPSLTIFADYRLHIVEVFLSSCVTFGTLLITGYPAEFAFIAISLEEVVSMINHSNLKMNYGPVFSKVLTSPQNHRIHHSREIRHLQNRRDAYNFAVLFPVWDILRGSYYGDITSYPSATGVAEEKRLETAGLIGRQWLALRDFWRELLDFRPSFAAARQK